MCVSMNRCFAALAAAVMIFGVADQCNAEWSFSWLGHLPEDERSFPYAVSADGLVVVGESVYGEYEDGYQPEAFRFTQSGGMTGLGFLPGHGQSWATGVSTDGSVVVGFGGGWVGNAFRWTQSGGMVDLGYPAGGAWSRAQAVSADGSVVVGDWGTETSAERAFRWTQDAGMVDLGLLPGGGLNHVFDVSADGSVVVGKSNILGAVFRTEEGGMVALGDLSEFPSSEAWGVSQHGSLIVGTYSSTSGGLSAFLWHATNGMRDLTELLIADGVDLGGGYLQSARDVSFDGQGIVVIGEGVDPNVVGLRGWVAVIPEPSSLALLNMAVVVLLVCVWRKRRLDGRDDVDFRLDRRR